MNERHAFDRAQSADPGGASGDFIAALESMIAHGRAPVGFVHADTGDRVDTDRQRRIGFPEVIYCESKTAEQLSTIIGHLVDAHGLAFGTRCSPELAASILEERSNAEYNAVARTLLVGEPYAVTGDSPVAVVSAGSSDRAVAEEAAVTLETFGSTVLRVFDAGVAGVHRLVAERERIDACRAIIAVAGMEGALPSLLGGIFPHPIIAVPTSVGYGTALGGLTPLFAILAGCAAGVTVVNIDNGFGAAMAVLRMTQRRNGSRDNSVMSSEPPASNGGNLTNP